MAKLPLEGIRIADFSWVIVAPYCTQWLAIMGAEVIRIESSVHLDILRRLPPFPDGIPGTNRSGLYNSLNMSKKSCTLDLTKPRAVELAKEIVRKSDIVVEQFGYGMMEKIGLGYDVLKELKEGLILVSASGLGRSGPECDFGAYNEEFLAYSGLASITGYEGGPPEMTGGVWADYQTGTHLTLAILSALYHRSKTGKGQYIDIAMAESVMSQMPEAIMDHVMNGRKRGPSGNKDDMAAPHGCYPCSGDDKWVAIAVSTDEEWHSFCDAVGKPEWISDPRFSDFPERWKHQEEMDKSIAEWTKKHNNIEIMEILQGAGIPAGPTFSLEEVVNNPHLKERGFYVTPNHEEVGKWILPGVPWKLSSSPLKVEGAPVLGQDNEYVFCELLGVSVEEFAELVGEGVIC
ncbi:CaiB/BaiF CoA transferase family protein [Chloroflexota bacterium]